MADDANKLEFRKKLYEKYAKCKNNLFPREVYNSTIEDLKYTSQVSFPSPVMTITLKKCEVLQCGDEKLIKKHLSPEDPPIYYAALKRHAIIQRAHIATGHGGRDRMLNIFLLSMQT